MLQKGQNSLFQIGKNGTITLHDLVTIDNKNVSQIALLQFLRLALMSNSRKLGLMSARSKLVLIDMVKLMKIKNLIKNAR